MVLELNPGCSQKILPSPISYFEKGLTKSKTVQAELELVIFLPSSAKGLGLQWCVTMPGLCFKLFCFIVFFGF